MRLLDRIRERFQRRYDLFSDPDEYPVAVTTAGEMTIAYEPHGIDTPQTLAEIVAQAQADAEAAHEAAVTEQWGEWDQPGKPLAPVAAPAPVPPPPPVPPSDLSRIMVSQIPVPQPGDLSYDRSHRYADYLRRIGAATGTSSSLEDTGMWPRFALEPGDGKGVQL